LDLNRAVLIRFVTVFASSSKVAQAEEAAARGQSTEVVSLLLRCVPNALQCRFVASVTWFALLCRVEDVCQSSMGATSAITLAARWRLANSYQRNALHLLGVDAWSTRLTLPCLCLQQGRGAATPGRKTPRNQIAARGS